MNENCPFCHWQTQQVLRETQNFCLIADKHPLREGHSLIIPKIHRQCLGELPSEQQTEFLVLLQYSKQILEQLYGYVSCWENGGINQSIAHAHLHLLPVSSNRPIQFSKEMWQSGRITRLENWAALFEWYKTNGYYRLFQNGGIEPPHVVRPLPDHNEKSLDETSLVRLRQIGWWGFIKTRIIRRGGPQMCSRFLAKWQNWTLKQEEQDFVN